VDGVVRACTGCVARVVGVTGGRWIVGRTGGDTLVEAAVGGGAATEVDGATAWVLVAAGVGVGAAITDAAELVDGAIAGRTGGAGMKAGRAVWVGPAGTASRASALEAVRVIPMATTAQPATASEAATDDTIRPRCMWLVCQV
jgi:hypothetical protein